MYGEERKEEILGLLHKQARVSVPDLCSLFNVSESTIRRDLKELEDSNLIKRTHGGAIPIESVNFEPTFLEKEDKFRQEKTAIAKKAIEFIEDGDTILIDGGTTTFHLVKELKAFQRLTVVTNSILIAEELQVNSIEVILLGGSLRRETLALVGPLTEQALGILNVDKAFIGTNGIDIDEGLTTPNLIEAATKRRMIKSAKQVILLTDHSKVGKVTFAKVAEITAVNKLIIDNAIPQNIINSLIELGIEVYTVQS